jgi:hypothetical protein
MDLYWSRHFQLERQFEGVTDPAQMGTTGLVAWVLVGPGGSRQGWNRARRALTILKRRGLGVEGFKRAVLAASYNKAVTEQFAGYFAKLK